MNCQAQNSSMLSDKSVLFMDFGNRKLLQRAICNSINEYNTSTWQKHESLQTEAKIHAHTTPPENLRLQLLIIAQV